LISEKVKIIYEIERKEKTNKMKMKTFKLTSKSFERIFELFKNNDNEEVTIRVCDKDFHLKKYFLPFISTILEDHFSNSNEPFIISLNKEIDANDSLFENVTSESLIESCSIFLKFLKASKIKLFLNHLFLQ
jgi:hypothetical protein